MDKNRKGLGVRMFFGMFGLVSNDIGIDLGTASILVYIKGDFFRGAGWIYHPVWVWKSFVVSVVWKPLLTFPLTVIIILNNCVLSVAKH